MFFFIYEIDKVRYQTYVVVHKNTKRSILSSPNIQVKKGYSQECDTYPFTNGSKSAHICYLHGDMGYISWPMITL